MSDFISRIREHAEAHYEDGGWDVCVECWEDADFARVIDDATTYDEALANVAAIVSVYDDRQADVRNSAF